MSLSFKNTHVKYNIMESKFWKLRTILTDSIIISSKRNTREFVIARDELDDFLDIVNEYRESIKTDEEKREEKEFEDYVEAYKEDKRR